MSNMITSGAPAAEDVREHIKGWNKASELRRGGVNKQDMVTPSSGVSPEEADVGGHVGK